MYIFFSPEKTLPISFPRATKPNFQHTGSRWGKGVSISPFDKETSISSYLQQGTFLEQFHLMFIGTLRTKYLYELYFTDEATESHRYKVIWFEVK